MTLERLFEEMDSESGLSTDGERIWEELSYIVYDYFGRHVSGLLVRDTVIEWAKQRDSRLQKVGLLC